MARLPLKACTAEYRVLEDGSAEYRTIRPDGSAVWGWEAWPSHSRRSVQAFLRRKGYGKIIDVTTKEG